MSKLSDDRKALIDFCRDSGFDEEDMLAINLLCRTDEQVKAMLDYCRSEDVHDFTDLLEKAAEIYGVKM